MAQYLIQDTTLTSIADAIRNKTGANEPIAVSNMATAIEGISDEGSGGSTTNTEFEDALMTGTISGNYTNNRIATLRGYAFASCKKLISVSLPNVTTSISQTGLFRDCSVLETVSMPNAKGGLGTQVFMNCYALTNIDFADEITSIGSQTFSYCKALVSLCFPKVTTVSGSAFSYCTSLETIDFSGSITLINTSLFSNCTALATLILRNTTMLTLSNVNAFTNTPIAGGTGYIYVPTALVETYKADSKWSTYAAQFRALEDYTVDGTITGELDSAKIAA